MQKIIIVIPCYNEAHRLDAVRFVKFAEDNSSINFLMVNDGSSDATARLLSTMSDDSRSKISWLNLVENLGKAEAVRLGI